MKSVAFIACSKTKASDPCVAWRMYQGSLFQKALSYCLTNHTEVYILSAKYGLLGLNDPIEPYEQTLNNASKQERKEWSQMVESQIKERGLTGEFWFYTGERYHELFEGKKPLQGLSLGRQLQWFNSHA